MWLARISPKPQILRTRDAADLDLDWAQQLLTFLEGQPDLLRRQVGDWPSDRANVVRDWRVAVRRQLKADREADRSE